MADPRDLNGLGMAAQLAELLSDGVPNLQNGTGTSQTGATVLRSQNNELNPSGGNTAFVLRSDAQMCDPYWVNNQQATTALVFVPSGHTLNGTLNASLSVAQNKAAVLFQYKSKFWFSILTA